MVSHWVCQCGEKLDARQASRFHGVRCPRCGRTVTRTGHGNSRATPSSANTSKEYVRVSCACGARFKAGVKLAGKRVRCSKCGETLVVPDDNAQLDVFEDLAPSEDPLDAAADMLAKNPPSPLMKARTSGSGIDKSTLVLIAAGGIIAVLLVLVGFLLLDGSSGDGSAVVQNGRPDGRGNPLSSKDDGNGQVKFDNGRLEQQRNGTAPKPPVVAAVGGIVPKLEPKADNEASEKETAEAGGALEPAVKDWLSDTRVRRGVIPVGDQRSVILQYSWMTQLLPYIGRQDLHDRINFERSWAEQENLPVAATVIPEFLNPLDDQETWKGRPLHGAALTHFVGVAGVGDRNVVAGTLPRTDPRAGVFGYEEVAKPEDIEDGLSNTVMVLGAGELAGPWIAGGGATVRGARSPYFDDVTGFGTKGKEPGTFAVLADGSTRFISKDVDPRVFRALCTIRGGETVDTNQQGPEPAYLPTKSRP